MASRLSSGGLLVSRNDGLGARLMPIVNALRLGQLLDIPVGIYWPAHLKSHNTAQYASLFSEEFRQTHLIPLEEYQTYRSKRPVRPEMDILQLTRDELLDAIAGGDYFFFENTAITLKTVDEDADSVNEGLSNALPQHYFAPDLIPHMDRIRAEMNSLPSLVYHVRHNDLTRSYKTRATEFANKYVPSEIYLAHMRENGIGETKQAMMIGDCDEPLDWIAARQDGIKRISHLFDRNSLTSLQYDFLELFAMSQGERIVAPEHSGFSKLAARLGNIPVDDVRATLSPDALRDALTTLATRLENDRSSFTCDGDAAQAIIHLGGFPPEAPHSTVDRLALREVEAGSAVPFILHRAALAAERGHDRALLEAIAGRAHDLMLPMPQAISAIDAIAANAALADDAIDEMLDHLRRALFLTPFVPSIASPLHAAMSRDDIVMRGDFFPVSVNPNTFGDNIRGQRLFAQAFIWDNWQFLSERFLMLLQRGNTSHHLVSNLINHERMLRSTGQSADADNLRNLLDLINFYNSSDNDGLQKLHASAVASEDSDNVIAIQRYSLALFHIKAFQEARQGFELLLQRRPHQRVYHGMLAETAFRQGDFKAALTEMEFANPKSAELARFIPVHVRLLDRARRTDRADELFLEFLVETGWASNFITQFCLRDLSVKQAQPIIDRLEGFADLAGAYRPVHAQLACLYERMGETEKAIQAFLRGFELGMVPPVILREAHKLAEKSGNEALAKACAQAAE